MTPSGTEALPAPARAARPPLVRERAVVVSGVSAALAAHLGWAVLPVRLVFGVALAVSFIGLGVTWVSGVGGAVVALPLLLFYAWMWALAPREPATPDAPRTRRAPVAILLMVASAPFALAGALAWNRTDTVIPLGVVECMVLLIAAVVWAAVVDLRDGVRASRAGLWRVIVSGILAGYGALVAVYAVLDGRAVVAIVGVAAVLAGAAGIVVPMLVARADARSAERAEIARTEQRSEIAAHLHDSVLQTLAIIQNRAGSGSEIARIARAQERELRDWLFAGTDPFAGDLATTLRTIARELELEYAVRIEVVTVGEVAEVESAALAAAAREALVNAARHAGGEVTVFAEATPGAVEVFVRDRGAGFETDAIPDARFGIRESIVGRMARAGGSATVTSGEGGTEVQLRLPRSAPASPASAPPLPAPASTPTEGLPA